MIKEIKSILLCLFIAIATTAHTQNTTGIITYKGVINKKHVDSFLIAFKAKKEVPMNVKQGVVAMYRNAKPDEYKLNFKKAESYYYHIPTLETNEGYNMGSKAGRTPFYTNKGTNTIIGMSRLGNIVHQPIDWDITRKTKNIGGYKCYQAIATEKLYSRQGHYYNRKVVAWFAPAIPLSFGPKYYNGLPGLILEIERPEFTISAIKINLNPDGKEIKIKRLDKNDKVITQKEVHSRINEMEADRKKSR